VVDDLPASFEFFVELGLESRGKGQVEGSWVEPIIALDDVKVEFAMLRTPVGHGEIELVKFRSPPTQAGDPNAPANTPGLRHLAFLVDDIHSAAARVQAGGTELVHYEDSYWLCYVRGPEGSSSSRQRRPAEGSRPRRERDHRPLATCSTGPALGRG
jgi:catechol 2,3-dioxygenase-like lactoylglutathione lyase family enzyme